MQLIESAGVESILPQVPASAEQAIDVLGIQEIRLSYCPGEGVGRPGDGHNVDVVRHQAIAKNRQEVGFTADLEKSKILQAVIVSEEDILTVVSALSDVVRLVLDHDSGSSRHLRNVKRSLPQVNSSIEDTKNDNRLPPVLSARGRRLQV